MATRLALLPRGAQRERLEALLTGKRRRNISKASRGDGPAHALGTARRYPRQADARRLFAACNRRRTHHLRNDFQIRSMSSSTTGKSAAVSLFMVNSTWILEAADSGSALTDLKLYGARITASSFSYSHSFPTRTKHSRSSHAPASSMAFSKRTKRERCSIVWDCRRFSMPVVRLVSLRVTERLPELCSANQKQEVWIQQLASRQARKLVRAIEKRFVGTGVLELRPEYGES
jgi:hypothetical protein